MFDKRKYDRQFDKENYHHINLVLPKDYKDLLIEASEKSEMSKNAFIRDAIERRLVELELL